MHLVLIGLPGSGKSSVGFDVARRLSRRFVDLDREIEQAFGVTVRDIFATHGEAVFRQAEAAASARLAGLEPAVIAPGGGWVANQDAVAPLRRSSRIIYLRVDPEEALQRMGPGVARRPLLVSGGDPLAALRSIHEARQALYEALADVVVDTAGLDREAVASRVAALATEAAGTGSGHEQQGG